MAEVTEERRALLERRKALLEKKKQLLEQSGFQTQRESAPTARTNAAIAGGARGIAGLLGLPVDTVTNVLNLAKAGYGTVTTGLGRPDLAPELTADPVGGSESISRGFNRLGINTENPRPEDPGARAAYTGGLVIGSSAMPIRGSAAQSGRLIPSLRQGFRPVETGLSAGAAGGTSLATDEEGLIGTAMMAPGLVGAVPGVVRGAIGKNVKQNVETFRQAGTKPTVGQATESPFLLALEEVFQKLPGGHRPLLGKFAKQQKEVGISAGGVGSAEAAGRSIEKGIGSFKGRTREVWRKMDTQLREELGPNSRIEPTATLETLDKLSAPIAEVGRSSQALVSDKMVAFRRALASDMADRKDLPTDSVRRLRSRVGELMDSGTSEISRGELKKIYGALSDDLKNAAIRADKIAASQGRKGKATVTWNRQNRYWRAREERIDTALDRVLGKSGLKLPEEVFAAAAPKNVEQVNLLRQVMRSLNPDEREVVSKAIVGRLGRATPGAQSDVGDVFSTGRFLQNWNKISPGAKAQIIPNAVTRKHLDSIAKTAFRIKETSKTGQEFAGRFGSLSQVIFAGVIGGAMYKGGLQGAAIAAGGGVTGIRLTGNLMANDKFVAWLAQSSKPVNPQAYAQRLAVIYNESDEQTKLELGDFMTSISELMKSRELMTIDVIGGQDAALPLTP